MRYILLFLIPIVLLAQPQQQQPWTEPFAGSPQAILRAAATITTPGDNDVVILLEEHHYEIQKGGRVISTERKVFRLLAQEAIDDWATLEQDWQPWHQSKPSIRARVISADGIEHLLDPKTIGDAPAFEWEPNIFSDDRVVHVPLPALAKGAVVEYQITTEDTAPLFAAGIAQEVRLDTGVPTKRFHLSLDAADGVPLHTDADLIPPSAVRRSELKHGIHIDIELGPLKKNDDFEANSPGDQPNTPAFRFSTGQSWQAIAATYSAAVDARISGSDLRTPHLLSMQQFGLVIGPARLSEMGS